MLGAGENSGGTVVITFVVVLAPSHTMTPIKITAAPIAEITMPGCCRIQLFPVAGIDDPGGVGTGTISRGAIGGGGGGIGGGTYVRAGDKRRSSSSAALCGRAAGSFAR